jgi:dipeptidyl aminopeptidase/acylaminoacyl peptidase
LGERVVRNDEVSGSIPLSSTRGFLARHAFIVALICAGDNLTPCGGKVGSVQMAFKPVYLTFLALFLAAPGAGHAQESVKATPSPAAAPPITLATFAAPPFLEDAELSPNGKWIAARLSIGGRQLLAMISLFEPAAKPVMVGLDSDKMSVDGWQWVNDDWLLLHISANDFIEGERIRIYRLASMSRLTGVVKPLLTKSGGQNAASVLWSAQDGTPRILVGVQDSIYSNFDGFWPDVRELDVSNGKVKLVAKGREPIFSYYADASGAVRLGYGYDSDTRTSRLVYRSGGKGVFKTIDRANLSKEEELSFPSLFLPAADQAITEDDPDGFSALYKLDLTTMKRGEKVFGVDKYDIGSIIPNVAGDGIAGVTVIENRPRTAWLDAGMAQTQADLDKAVGAGNAHIVSWDRAMQKLLVKVGGADQAGAYYLYDRGGAGKMSRIGYADESLKMRKLASVTTITYKARDGLVIPAVLTLPNGRAAKDLPLILLPHGGPGARDYETWDWMTQFFAWRGYAVSQPNYRGSTGYGEAHYKKGEGEWGLKMQDDLNDAVSHLAAHGMVDAKRVCIVGGSYGGYAALRGAQRDGDKFRCAISYAGVSDLPRIVRYDGRFLYGREYKSHLKKQAPDLTAVSPLRFPEQFSTPVLLMHGKLDLTVPVEQSREMADRLKAASKAHRYVEQPLGDHHFSRKEDRLQFLQEVDAFLAKYNPADGQVAPK